MARPVERRPLYLRVLDGVERAGNVLPHPFWLFCWLIGFVVVGSWALEQGGVAVRTPEAEVLRTDGRPGRTVVGGPGFDGFVLSMPAASRSSRLDNLYVEVRQGDRTLSERKIGADALAHLEISPARFSALKQPGTYTLRVVNRSKEIRMKSLLSAEGLRWIVLNLVTNFAHFEPLGIVLVMLMGVAIAEGAGLIPAVMRAVALSVPERLITPVLFALAACGNIGSDAGIVVIPPLAAAIYRQMGKSPIVGLLVGYVGATAGFTANLFPAGTDVLAMSLTNAATGNDPEISVLANWYFMVASVFFLAIIGSFVTHRLVEPRIPSKHVQGAASVEGLTPLEKRGLFWAFVGIGLVSAAWATTLLFPGAPLRHPDPSPDLFWRSPFFKGLVPILFTLFAVGGVVYGRLTGSVRRADDVLGFMSDSMKRMGGYIVLILVIAQFTKAFQFTGLDRLIAIQGADLLRALGFESAPIPFFVAFIFAVAVANLFMGSASAKWAIFAPIFVPMFMSLGFHPAFTQLLYRLGDSITNCVTPLYPFFPLLLGWIHDEDPERAKVGTVLSYLVPYAFVLLGGWIVMMVLWYLTGIPIGPGSPIRL